jgi:uncharacterized integral membrane protein
MRFVYIALIVLITVAVLLFKVQNLDTVTVSFLSTSFTLPISILIILIYILGMVTGSSLLGLMRSIIRKASPRRH